MKAALLFVVLATAFQAAPAADILFTNRSATFTDLQGRSYQRVQLVRGDLDGLIWRDGASGGRICYTNLAPDLLESFGISSNRIEVARARAEKKALVDARYRSMVVPEPAVRNPAPPGATNAQPTVQWANGSQGSQAGYAPDSAYNPNTFYPWVYGSPFEMGLAPAPRAASAPTAASSASASSAPGAGSASGAPPAPRVPLALNSAPAPSAHSAPPAVPAPSVPVRRR